MVHFIRRSGAVAVITAAAMFTAGGQAQADANDSGTESPHRYVQDGVTITWGDSDDMSDLKITKTPGATTSTNSGTDKKVGSAILAAYRQTNGATQPVSADDGTSTPRAGAAKTDYCTWSPDSYGSANFKPACASHDSCYSSSSKSSRLTCDKRFKSALNRACNSAYDDWYDYPDKKACNGVAWTYYQAVRKAGKSHYNGQGSSA